MNKKEKQKRELALLMANPEEILSVKELCERVNIARSTYYEWIKDAEFLKQVSDLIDNVTDAELGNIWKALTNKCKDGDLGAIGMFFELKGKYQKEGSVDGNININIKTID